MKNSSGKFAGLHYICICLLAGALATAVYFKYEADLRLAKQNYQSEKHKESIEIARTVEWVFNHTYEGIRTIARLPGIQEIDHHGTNLDKNTLITVQELYNNIAFNASVSEIYIVPEDLDPDVIDPHTNKPGEPILMFDQLIVGRNAVSKDAPEKYEGIILEETEIHEYRLLKNQMTWLKSNYPNFDRIKDLNYPALTGKEVITCDNSRTDPTHLDDRDRSGLVYSVPFFNPQGELKGSIAAIFLSHVFRDLLPSQNYALLNHQNKYITLKSKELREQHSLSSIKNFKKNPDLIYSDMLRLNIIDASGSWALWVGLPDQLFWQRQDVRLATQTAMFQYFVILTLSVVAFFSIWAWGHQKKFLHQTEIKLQKTIEQRTLELQKTQEMEIKAAVSMRAAKNKSDFLASMSHEIRTPLNSVLGFCELLHFTDLDPQQKDYIEMMSASGNHLLSIINDILDFSKFETGNMVLDNAPFDLEKVVSETSQLLSPQIQQKKLLFKQEIASNAPRHLMGDARRLKQILINLLANAVKFTSKGSVGIAIELLEDAPDAALLRFSVKDSGIGISKEDQKSLFQAFAQGQNLTQHQYGGTGLGLAISKQIIDAMEGRIWVESDIGAGTTISFEINYAKSSAPSHNPPSALGATLKSDYTELKILAVDDVAANRKLLKALLDKLGCFSFIVNSGEEAVEHLRNDVSTYDLCLMDAQMPGISGEAATRIIRAEISKTLPIIALTAATFKDEQERFKNAGMNDFLPKPLSLSSLKDMLLRYVSK